MGGFSEKNWSCEDAQQLYRMSHWSQGYFQINEAGQVCVNLPGAGDSNVSLEALIAELAQQQVFPPVLLRFPDILADRIKHLHEAFEQAIQTHHYQNSYHCVYPIKVNQHRPVVKDVLMAGKRWGMGLEVGSRPELLIAMAMVDNADTPIVCNGFKDDAYIEAVVLTAKMGRRIILVIEHPRELHWLIKQARRHQVQPQIGLRVKLMTHGAGQWEDSGGERSKFGLLGRQVVQAIDLLKTQNMLDCLKLLHFHLGSQVSDLHALERGLVELARVYVGVRQLGVEIQMLDIGGGLGIDYDTTASTGPCSANYNLKAYASAVVHHIGSICDQSCQPHPQLMSESGRALTAAQSVLVFNVLGCDDAQQNEPFEDISLTGDEPAEVAQLQQLLQSLEKSMRFSNIEIDVESEAEAELDPGSEAVRYQAIYHKAAAIRGTLLEKFFSGTCRFEDRVLGGRLFYQICLTLKAWRDDRPLCGEAFLELETLLARTFFCNLSIFQSLPDSWAIGQIFPIMPLHRLDHRPTEQAVLADITCDSDGKMDRFVRCAGVGPTLPLHRYEPAKQYLLGAFLVGAYQEILGDKHNLFGDTPVVEVRLNAQGQAQIGKPTMGQRVREIVRQVQYAPGQLSRSVRRQVSRASDQGLLTPAEALHLQSFYDASLDASTYLSM